MKKKNYLTLDNEFIQYCELNNIDDIEKFANEVFQRGFTITKYGDKPKINPLTEGKIKTNVKNNIDTGLRAAPPPPPLPPPDRRLKEGEEPRKPKNNNIYDE